MTARRANGATAAGPKGAGGAVSLMWKTVSSRCNLACDYCYYGAGALRRRGRIDTALLDKVIGEQMALSRGTASFLWQGGEPLLAGLEFFEAVAALQARHARSDTLIANALQTNGTLIDADWAAFFRRHDFFLGVSLDGPREIHDARRRTASGRGSFDQVMRGIGALRQHGVEFNILAVVHEGNVERARGVLDFFEREGLRYLQFIPAMDFRAQAPSLPVRYLISPQQYGEFLCEAFDVWFADGSPRLSIRLFDNLLSVCLGREPELCTQRARCPEVLVLEPDGDAYPCDFYISDEYLLGNAGTDGLAAIAASPVFSAFQARKARLPAQCAQCRFLTLCRGGCPRNRPEGAGDPDYFCEAYRRLFAHSEGRLQALAARMRAGWIREHAASGDAWPGRNDACICGGAKKFKHCCGPLAEGLGMAKPTAAPLRRRR